MGETVRAYVEHGGPLEQLTISSDARTHGGTVAKLHAQLVSCVREHGMSLEEALPLLTTNTARALKLARKGRLAAGMDADVTVLDSTTLEVVHVVARGRHLVRDGAYAPDLESDAAENAALTAS